MTWTKPVTDRTTSDLAKKTAKAYLNAVDLSRIERNVDYLAEHLSALRYQVKAESRTIWSREDIPTIADIERICGNIVAITEGYYKPEGFTDPSDITSKEALDYGDVNRLEQYLMQVKGMLDKGRHYNRHQDLKRSYKYKKCRSYRHEQLRKGADEHEKD